MITPIKGCVSKAIADCRAGPLLDWAGTRGVEGVESRICFTCRAIETLFMEVRVVDAVGIHCWILERAAPRRGLCSAYFDIDCEIDFIGYLVLVPDGNRELVVTLV